MYSKITSCIIKVDSKIIPEDLKKFAWTKAVKYYNHLCIQVAFLIFCCGNETPRSRHLIKESLFGIWIQEGQEPIMALEQKAGMVAEQDAECILYYKQKEQRDNWK